MNGVVLAPFKYLEHKKVKAKLCPQCDSPLHIKTIFSCDKCGDLAYKKTDEA
jgi:ribosomal protein L37AE/L43A